VERIFRDGPYDAPAGLGTHDQRDSPAPPSSSVALSPKIPAQPQPIAGAHVLPEAGAERTL